METTSLQEKYTGNGMKGVRTLSDTYPSVDLSYPDNYRFINTFIMPYILQIKSY